MVIPTISILQGLPLPHDPGHSSQSNPGYMAFHQNNLSKFCRTYSSKPFGNERTPYAYIHDFFQ